MIAIALTAPYSYGDEYADFVFPITNYVACGGSD